MGTFIFAPDLMEYAFVGVSLSDAKFMEESNQMNLVKLLVFVPLFHAQIKHVLIYFTPEIASIIIARRSDRREQEAPGRRERIFPQMLSS